MWIHKLNCIVFGMGIALGGGNQLQFKGF